jgi:hypothetical protein
MPRLLPWLLASALLTVPAFATLGSNPDECAARYGAGTAVKNGVPLTPPTIKTTTTIYRQGPFTIIVKFAKGKAVQLSIYKPSRKDSMEGVPFTGEELTAFIQPSLGNWENQRVSESTMRYFNKTRIATYEGHNHWLRLETKAYAEAEEKDAKREMEEMMDGPQ